MTDDIAALKRRIAELEQALGLLQRSEPAIRLKGVRVNGWKLVGLLLRWGLVTHDVAFAVIYGSKPEADQPDIGIIRTNISRLRSALRPHGITILGEYGGGYYLDKENKRRLAILAGREEDCGRPDHFVIGRGRGSEHSFLETN